jgi:hypothetical protein
MASTSTSTRTFSWDGKRTFSWDGKRTFSWDLT